VLPRRIESGRGEAKCTEGGKGGGREKGVGVEGDGRGYGVESESDKVVEDDGGGAKDRGRAQDEVVEVYACLRQPRTGRMRKA
jgi:hypothetical protein